MQPDTQEDYAKQSSFKWVDHVDRHGGSFGQTTFEKEDPNAVGQTAATAATADTAATATAATAAATVWDG